MYGDWAWPTGADSYEAHNGFIELLKSRGAYVDGEELTGPGRAVSLRDELRADGPFAESTERLCGFYLIDARDLDEAIELAKACPEPTVEVRPVVG
ncbi:YciI family protein [Nonomuraea sp. NN258]|nr:YciI family protein [Nonomuraea antri]